MPKIYSQKIRKALKSLNLTILKKEIELLGYDFIREGHYSKDKEPFKFCNYLHYLHPETKVALRIGYNYGILHDKETSLDLIFEICYATENTQWWIDVTPDFRQTKWRKISNKYINI